MQTSKFRVNGTRSANEVIWKAVVHSRCEIDVADFAWDVGKVVAINGKLITSIRGCLAIYILTFISLLACHVALLYQSHLSSIEDR